MFTRPARTGLALLVVLSAGPAGCTWVSSKDVDDRRGQVDDDGDGYVADEDCDETNPLINPGVEDNWYDGIDQDCGGDDDYDADGDGYVYDAYVGVQTQGVEGTGNLPGGDCDDTDAGAAPGQPDSWYDGVDTNCDNVDDYDQDGDGYVPDEYVGLETANASETGDLPGGDCDDLERDVNPGETDDWYDGIDQDCSGNDDYDQDGDGWVRTEDAGKATTYVAGSGGLSAGDCEDLDAAIYPGAPDTWYDNVDSDCAGDDDFDRDLDGHREPSAPEGDGDDCDDDDPTAYPGRDEVLGDDIDHDCDGDPDRFILAELDSVGWTGPHDVRFSQNSSSLYMSIAAERVTYGASTFYDSAIAVGFDQTEPLAGSTSLIAWLQNLVDQPFSLTQGHAFYATDDALVGAVGLDFSSSNLRALRITGYDLGSFVRFGANSPSTSYEPFDDVAIAVSESDEIHAIGCDSTDGIGRYMRGTRTGLATSYDVTEEIPGLDATKCTLHFFNDPTGTIVSVQDAGLVTLPFDATSETPFADIFDCDSGGGDTGGSDTGGGDTGGGDTGGSCEDPTTVDPDFRANDVEVVPGKSWLLVADAASDAVVLVFPSGVEEHIPVVDPLYAQAAVGPDNTIYVAYVDGSGVPGLAWGTVALGFEQVELDPGFTASEAALQVTADGEVLMVAVVGGNEVVVGGVLLD